MSLPFDEVKLPEVGQAHGGWDRRLSPPSNQGRGTPPATTTPDVARTQAIQRPPSRILASGRRKWAGWLVCGGGLAVVVSAFLPWVTVVGFISVGLGAYAIIVLALGGALAVLGSRILLERTSRGTTIGLWVLACLDLIALIALFYGQSQINGSGGLVQPGEGFYLALVGFLATLIGTIVIQASPLQSGLLGSAVSPTATSSSLDLLSEDRQFWWDGAKWRSTDESAPPCQPRSPDGSHWWDGVAWRPIPTRRL
jgi:hypothetical protein